MSLGFVFLGINIGFGNDVIVEKQWKLGLMLLLEVTKVNRNNANFIIHQICDNIVTKQNVSPYIGKSIAFSLLTLTLSTFRMFTHALQKTGFDSIRKSKLYS